MPNSTPTKDPFPKPLCPLSPLKPVQRLRGESGSPLRGMHLPLYHQHPLGHAISAPHHQLYPLKGAMEGRVVFATICEHIALYWRQVSTEHLVHTTVVSLVPYPVHSTRPVGHLWSQVPRGRNKWGYDSYELP